MQLSRPVTSENWAKQMPTPTKGEDYQDSVLSPQINALPFCPYARVLATLLSTLEIPLVWQPLNACHYVIETWVARNSWPMPTMVWAGRTLNYDQALDLLASKDLPFDLVSDEAQKEEKQSGRLALRSECRDAMNDFCRYLVHSKALDITQHWRLPARSSVDYESQWANIVRFCFQGIKHLSSDAKCEQPLEKFELLLRRFFDCSATSEASNRLSILDFELIIFSSFLGLAEVLPDVSKVRGLEDWAQSKIKQVGLTIRDCDFQMHAWHATRLTKKGLGVFSQVQWQLPLWRLLVKYIPAIRLPFIQRGKLSMVFSYEMNQKLLQDPRVSVESVYLAPMRNIVGDFVLGLDEGIEARGSHEVLKKMFMPLFEQADELVPAFCKRYLNAYFSDNLSGSQPVQVIDFVDAVSVRVVVHVLIDQMLNLKMGHYAWWASNLRTLFNSIFYQSHNDFLRKKSRKIGEMIQGRLSEHYVALSGSLAHSRDSLVNVEGVSENQFVLNMLGVLVGSVETINRSMVNMLDSILKDANRYRQLESALEMPDSTKAMSIISEIHRQYPCTPFMKRSVKSAITLDCQRSGKKYQAEFKAGDSVMLNLMAANYDPFAMAHPRAFLPGERPYNLQFGSGFHRCFGEKIAKNIWVESFRFLFQNFRLESMGGKGARPKFDGPMCEHFWIRLIRKN